ncbi:uncharacterized protein B0J16DRAFT_381765 [Fusarium flagelliforme]|uniref:uncharacterized protein n=1 Tax=Fusarium flagelliforme TaxID=2675880 RepID=UPI001E8D0120|nr:uncharacterized protein B0J16DRAFT_381765 [Fusarium flagelliforme]KAH7193883.1 hypothetical protein B0J16DRAFT_381765 [Fusarium flagelliforme]
MKFCTSKAPPKLLQLPKELRDSIYFHLDNGDIKNLRATCSAMNRDVPLRPTRVFLSANSLNIKVFRAVADHERLRHSVTEIVWDDARLKTKPDFDNYGLPMQQPGCTSWFCSSRFRPWWFKRRSVNIWYSKHYLKPPFGVVSWHSPCICYKALIKDQDDITASDFDIQTFKYGLRRFPALNRVTITPSTHGTKLNPLYKTPMIKAFHPGFYCPTPRAWPGRAFAFYREALAWTDYREALAWTDQDGPLDPYQMMYGFYCTAESYRSKWRGYRAATRALAEDYQHHVTELVVGGNEVGSGINCHIFDQPCVEYNDLVNLLQRPGFSHLSLDLFTGCLEHEDWVSYRSGLLRAALRKAKDLRYICIRTTTDMRHLECLDFEDREEMGISLSTMFPMDHWPQLEHFGLSGFMLDMNDLVEVLAALPASLRSVELSHLAFTREGDNYESFLVRMRDTLDWSSRPERPKVRIIAIGN